MLTIQQAMDALTVLNALNQRTMNPLSKLLSPYNN